MKKILTGALAIVLFAGAAQAQSKQDTSFQHHRDGHQMAMKQLNLTADQKAQLKKIHESERQDMQALKNNSSLTADQLKTQRQDLHKKYHEQVQSVFTPSQKEQLKKLHAERKENGNKKGDWKNGGKGFWNSAEFQKELNLTGPQKTQLSQMRTDFKGQMQSVRNDQSLTQDQKKEKMHSLMKAQHEKMKTVLTKEQMEKLQSLRKERGAKNTK